MFAFCHHGMVQTLKLVQDWASCFDLDQVYKHYNEGIFRVNLKFQNAACLKGTEEGKIS
jgi:hypothetical protein